MSRSRLHPLTPGRRGDYGFDAPYAPVLMAVGGACLLALTAWNLWSGDARSTRHAIAVFAPGVAGLWMFLHAGVFVHTTRKGKFAVWADLLDRLELKGDERLLDIGCGRGAVLLMAAQRLPRGRAVGVDVWRAVDQSGNAEEVTRRNAALEGVGAELLGSRFRRSGATVGLRQHGHARAGARGRGAPAGLAGRIGGGGDLARAAGVRMGDRGPIGGLPTQPACSVV